MRNVVFGLIVGGCVLVVVSNIALIGKPRKPITSGVAIFAMVLNALEVWGVWYLWR